MEIACSCQSEKISAIFASLDSHKISLLESIGFDHLFRLPSLGKVNLKLCLWLYQAVDTENKCLRLDRHTSLPYAHRDVSLVFGIPSQGRPVDYSPLQSGLTVHDFIHKLGRVSHSPSLSLSFLEHLVTRQYQTPMSPDEADVFKIAAVLFASTYLLAPEPEHRFPMELVKNFLPLVDPGQLNWADLVLRTIARASTGAKLQLKDGAKNICLFGCCLFLQVFYLDNLNFGPSTPRHNVLPRISIFTTDLMSQLIMLDSDGVTHDGSMKFGNRQLRDACEVWYTRRCKYHVVMKEKQQDNATPTHIIGDAIRMLDKFPREANQMTLSYDKLQCKFNDAMTNLSNHAADFLRTHRPALYHYSGPGDVPSSSMMVPFSVLELRHARIVRKVVTTHSKFPMSPFDVNISHSDVHSKDKYTTYNWMADSSLSFDTLSRDWIVFNTPEPLSIPGHVVRHCLKQNGTFTVSMVDAIMVLWDYLDRVVYKYHGSIGNIHRRWRHFLPASFAEVVLDSYNTHPDYGENYYLNSPMIRSSLIGDHITYDVENCQKIILPVIASDGTWSCLFWDFKVKSITVLDPMFMSLGRAAVREKHCSTVKKLHKAMVDCIHHFFSGWNVEYDGWSHEYIIDFPPRSKPQNSGLYAVHYARSFTGSEIAFKLKEACESSFSGARGEILYQMFACSDNKALRPRDLMERITIIEW